jgi:putative glutamine amidotransferase
MKQRPIIGITPDVELNARGREVAIVGLGYADAIVLAGGVPIVLAPCVERIGEQLAMCDGFVLTGGGDPRMEEFGEATHAAASLMHPRRQEYELALIDRLMTVASAPVLGICLGMQLMCLKAGGRLEQHLPDVLPTAARHRNASHIVEPVADAVTPAILARGMVDSFHHQAVREPGRLRVLARSDDGVIEAVCDPVRPFYLGVQWHPERTADETLGAGVFASLLAACRR